MNISAGYIIYGLILLRGVTDSKANRHYHFSKWIKTSKTKNAGVYVFDWQLRLSVSQCMKVCNVTKACQFFNYETRPHLCGLIRIDESSKVEVEQKPGYVYGNKSEWTQNAANICDKCNDTGRCNNDDLTDKKNDVCRNSGCEAPSGTDFKGNMFTAGSKVKCKVDHQKQSFDLKIDGRNCTENGTWPPFSCLKSLGGSYYLPNPVNKSWQDAKAFCENHYGHLVDINTDEESALVVSMVITDLRILHMGIWIGGNDIDEEGIWRWSDSSLIDNWIGENPSNTGGNEHCAEVVVAKVFKYAWNDNKCSVKKPFICEIE